MQYLALCLWLFCFFTCMNCRFLQQPQPIKYGCTSKAVTLPWKVDAFGTIAFLEWTYNSTTTIMRQIGPTGTPTPEGAYVGRVENGSNSELLIKSTTIADTGGYQCIINYSNGTQVPSDVVSLYIRDEWSVMVEITGKKDGQSTTLKSNVDDPSIQQTWSTGFQGSSITVDKDGIYSLCISGGKADCLDSSSNNCTSYTVEGLACTGAFECGFCPILIVVVSSVIICILMWKEVPKRIGGFSTVKIVIIVIFSVVAIGIGLGLGLGLREGEENCLNCGATIGISISLGVALSVMQFAIIFNCNNEKGCKDSKGVTSDRSNGDRARTPTSASGVTMEAKKKSLNKPTEKGTEVSSLNTKPVGHPLPETPNGRKNQLEPIKTDSVEVDNSAREKKKKKKKKEKKEKKEEKERKEEEKKENSEEEGQRPELQF